MKSRLVKDTFYYSFFNFTERAISFIILPIITRILTKEDIGYYILYQAMIEVLIPVMSLNIDSSILLNFYKLDDKEFTKYFGTGLSLFVLVYFVVLIVGLVFSDSISSLLQFPFFWLNIIFIIVAFRFFVQLRQNLWRVRYRLKSFGIFTIGIAVLKNVLGLVLVFYTDLGWRGLIIGHLIGYFVFAIYALFTFYQENLIKITKNLTYVKDLFKVGFPLSLHKLGLWLGNAANRIIITGILGAAATGSYGIGATFGLMVTLIEDAFTKAFIPHLFDKLKNITENKKYEIVKLSYYVYIFLIVISIVVFILGYFSVGLIFGEEYLDTREFILPLILAAMFKGFYKLHASYIMFTKKTYKITQITFTTGILNIALAYFMIQQFGLLGAAYSMLIITFLQYIFSFYVGNKLIPMPWNNFISNRNSD